MSILEACQQGDVARVKLLLSSGAEINDRTKYHSSLHIACVNGNCEIVKLLLASEGIDVNYGVHCYTDYCSPLLAATTRGFRDIVKLLLKADGIDVNSGCYMMSCTGQYYDKTDTPLYYACKAGDYETVKLLLNCKNIEVNRMIYNYDEPNDDSMYVHSTLCHDISDCREETTALYAACKRGYSDIVKLLLQVKEISVNEGSVSPLYAAIKGNFIDIIECLLSKGAIVDEKCYEAAEEMNIDIDQIERMIVNKFTSLFKARERSTLGKQVFGGDIFIQTIV